MAAPPTHLGLVFGGLSGEHAVSIRSAITVAGALRRGANAELGALLEQRLVQGWQLLLESLLNSAWPPRG